jgi:HEAT repeat protein
MQAVGGTKRRALARVAGAFLTSLSMCGCVDLWDTVSSRNFEFASLWKPEPNPLVVLRDSTDGDDRAKALRRLAEPKLHGGTDQDQDAIVTILVTAAKTDPQPLCRLAAIEALGRFQDPRAAQGLIDAFFAVTVEEQRKQGSLRSESFAANTAFPPETANVIQCEALAALGRTKNPAGVELLARVARPGPRTVVEASESEKQQYRDLRLAAVRALGNFQHYQATETLVTVLEKDKDVALHDRALESLQMATGKKLEDDPKAWQELIHQAPTEQNAATPKPKENKIDLVGWFKGL